VQELFNVDSVFIEFSLVQELFNVDSVFIEFSGYNHRLLHRRHVCDCLLLYYECFV
jgi:hypothetical protein